jgi:putative FmdB family regulatory protein
VIGNPGARRFIMSVGSVTAVTDSVSGASYDEKRTSRPSAFSGLSGSRLPGEVVMPVYEYVCNECHTAFEVILTIKEHDKEEIFCPKCGCKKVEQAAAEFYAVTSHKS